MSKIVDSINAVSEAFSGTAASAEASIAEAIQHIADHYTPPEGGFTPAAAQADSTATEVEGLVADFNVLLDKFRTAGIIAGE